MFNGGEATLCKIFMPKNFGSRLPLSWGRQFVWRNMISMGDNGAR